MIIIYRVIAALEVLFDGSSDQFYSKHLIPVDGIMAAIDHREHQGGRA
jgi:hypothetical protein